ncbi:MAG: hypothetical protein WCK89_11365 [bacterium]
MRRNVSFGWFLGLIGAAGILFGTTAGAANAPAAAGPPAAVSTNVQDYSQGFRAFIRMGLPDTSKAKYVKLNYNGDGMRDMYMYRMQEIQLSGNAWLVSENKEGTSVLVSSAGRVIELADQKTLLKKQEAEARSNAVAHASAKGKDGVKPSGPDPFRRANDLTPSGTWAPADLSRDLVKATSYVDKKVKAKAGGGREARYDSFFLSDEEPGGLFLLAVFAWQNGKVQEANVLVGKLFTLIGDSRKVIVGALNIVADDQLAAAAEGFQKKHDWKAYHAAVSGLLKAFPAGWRRAGAVKLLADRLQARAALTEPPALAGEGLGEEDQKLAAALASETVKRDGYYGRSEELWVFPNAKPIRGTKDDSAIGRILARGIKSLPLLIALVPDETLCPMQRTDMGMSSYSSYSGSDSEKSEAERSLALYNQMDRPLTRGEIARKLLQPVCTFDENARQDEDEITPEDVAEAAKKTYATLKALPPSALAPHFLKSGNSQQKQFAVYYMLENDVETNAPLIEAHLLTPPPEDSSSMSRYENGMAQLYVEKRGEKAAAFVEKYADMLKKIELPAEMAGDAKVVKQRQKQLDSEIKTLRALVKKQDLTETVTDLTTAGDENASAMRAYTALARQPPAQAIPALLAAAVQSTNVAVRSRIIQMMPMLRYAGMEERMQEVADPEAIEAAMKGLAEKNKLTIGTNAASWRILMADTRALPEGRMYSGGSYEMTVADMAATSIETLYGEASLEEGFGGIDNIENIRPEVAIKVIRSRAAARLEGKTEDQLPKMPSADDVTADRRKAIDTDVVKATPEALAALLAKLTDAESLYLTEAAQENEAVMKALAPLTRRIASVKAMPSLPAAEAARLQKLAGTTVSTNAIAEMQAVCQRQLALGAALAVKLSSDGFGKGLSINVTPVDEDMRRGYGGMLMSMTRSVGGLRKGMVSGVLRGGETYSSCSWLVDVPAAAAPTGTVATAAVAAEGDDDPEDRLDSITRSLESQQEQFAAQVETFCTPDNALDQNAYVTFSGMLPPKPKAKKPGAEDEEEEDVDGDGGFPMIDPFMVE